METYCELEKEAYAREYNCIGGYKKFYKEIATGDNAFKNHFEADIESIF